MPPLSAALDGRGDRPRASSSATPTSRHSPSSIARMSPEGGRRASCSPGTRHAASPRISPSCRTARHMNRQSNSAARTDYSRIGRIERRVRRALIIHGPMSTTELRLAVYGEPFRDWQRKQIRRAAAKFAVEVGRGRSGGMPTFWRLKMTVRKVANLRTVLFAHGQLLSQINGSICNRMAKCGDFQN
jgi:hypothetical protein